MFAAIHSVAALGGRVAPATRGEVGILPVELTAAGREHPFLRNVPARWQRAHDLMVKVGLVPAGDATAFYTNEFIDKAKG